MLVLSSSSPPLLELFKDRVSSSSFSSSSSPSSFPFTLRRYRTSSRFLVCYNSSLSSKLRLKANAAFPTSPVVAEVVGADGVVNNYAVSNGVYSRTYVDARSGEELLAGIRRESEIGKLSVTIASGMEEVYQNYRDAVLSSGNPQADEVILSNMSAMLDLVMLDVEDPFQFQPYHKAIREPFDYYMFGQNYIRPLVDFGNSYVGNVSVFSEMEAKLQQGHNIILMSNHQTEADPAIIALLLEKTNPHIAENLIYIAGDRVVTDPLCKPFSMGRNLLCVYSKKHMYDVPELVDVKRKANTRSLKEMALLLRRGSQLIWIAPSGGRDRPDPVTDEWYPAVFDVASVDNMRRLVAHAGVPGHIYPLALLCHDIMPPPPQVEKEIGEKRLISFHGTGVSVEPAIYHDDFVSDKSQEEAKLAYAKALHDSVSAQYEVLKTAIKGEQGLGASTSTVSLSQPWT